MHLQKRTCGQRASALVASRVEPFLCQCYSCPELSSLQPLSLLSPSPYLRPLTFVSDRAAAESTERYSGLTRRMRVATTARSLPLARLAVREHWDRDRRLLVKWRSGPDRQCADDVVVHPSELPRRRNGDRGCCAGRRRCGRPRADCLRVRGLGSRESGSRAQIIPGWAPTSERIAIVVGGTRARCALRDERNEGYSSKIMLTALIPLGRYPRVRTSSVDEATQLFSTRYGSVARWSRPRERPSNGARTASRSERSTLVHTPTERGTPRAARSATSFRSRSREAPRARMRRSRKRR